MDFNQIQELIRMVSKHKLSEFTLKEGDFKLVIRNQPVGGESYISVAPAMPVQQPVAPAPAAPAQPAKTETAAAPAPAAAAGTDEENNPRYKQIKSPMVGTFYRSAGPDKGPFVKVGDSIELGSKVCIIEAMKLFNEIESELKGKIVKVLVEDATPVEYDQPLFLIDPS
ncbi:MAG TPA: acetyl-CoA carboxylase biotin carboxyl carrier protein [Saprospiraceae bacterium]|nr:acetyl-CoA carboxylase biotin carboxyl carrier protein [Saprospiraceae bacterium]HPI08274.1 acetyl-CoA carboxylase biotin carboxyl carrier protein [Saprospiraceae bacterium]